ncbi:MAG TPA: hypothetical protein VIE19_08390 [Lapillicoccus sp.]
MAVPHALRRINKRVTNPLLRGLAGHGWFVELEHVGRRSGRTFRTPLMAFRDGPTVTIALTYGPTSTGCATSGRPVGRGCTSAPGWSRWARRRR